MRGVAREAPQSVHGFLGLNVRSSRVYFMERDEVCVATAWVEQSETGTS